MGAQALKYSVGIDVSKPELEVCFKELLWAQSTKVKGSRKFPNTPKGFQLLDEWAGKRCGGNAAPLTFVMEATGVYHERLAHYLHGQGRQVSVVLPSQSKDYIRSLGYKSKTDRIDGKGLAQMGAERKLRPWAPPTKLVLDIRSLCRHKDMLEKTKTRFSNRLHAHLHSAGHNPLVVKLLGDQIKCLGEQAEEVGAAIEGLLAQQSDFGDRARKVAGSIKGLGVATVASVAAEANGFELFRSLGQATSYAGYDVAENQSGKRSGRTKISKKGNSHIRKALYFPALNVVRYEVKIFSDLYARVYERTGVKMKGYVAVQRKLLCMIYTLWKKNEAFDPDHQQGQGQKKGQGQARPLGPI